MRILPRGLLVFLFVSSAGFYEAMGQTESIAVKPSRWGGSGVEFVVRENTVAIEYDCAHGEIPTQLKTDKQGNFVVAGFHKRVSPGALRPGLQPKAQPAKYTGKITGGTLRYKVTLTETSEVVGEFALDLDKEGQLRRCR